MRPCPNLNINGVFLHIFKTQNLIWCALFPSPCGHWVEGPPQGPGGVQVKPSDDLESIAKLHSQHHSPCKYNLPTVKKGQVKFLKWKWHGITITFLYNLTRPLHVHISMIHVSSMSMILNVHIYYIKTHTKMSLSGLREPKLSEFTRLFTKDLKLFTFCWRLN